MQGVFRGGGGGVSMSTVSTEDNAVMSSEDSSCPDESELELGLGLSLGSSGCCKAQHTIKGSCHQYARILTAKDLPSVVSSSSSSSMSSSSSSSSSTLSRVNATAGTKRSADSVSPLNAAKSSQVVGWPPIRAYRMNSMVNQAKSLATEEFSSMIGKTKSKNIVVEKANDGSNMNNNNCKVRTSLFVKVNMDGIPIGRKVDMNAHGCYETLAQTLEDMFLRHTSTINTIRSSMPEHNRMADAAGCPKLLDVSSEFVLTYEDREGDWMLVGDVPWVMFLGCVKRLRITRKSEATGLAPRFQERNGRQKSKAI